MIETKEGEKIAHTIGAIWFSSIMVYGKPTIFNFYDPITKQLFQAKSWFEAKTKLDELRSKP